MLNIFIIYYTKRFIVENIFFYFELQNDITIRKLLRIIYEYVAKTGN